MATEAQLWRRGGAVAGMTDLWPRGLTVAEGAGL